MKVKVSEASGPVLDWLVVYIRTYEATGGKPILTGDLLRQAMKNGMASPSTNWAEGGPIIDRENIGVGPGGCARKWNPDTEQFDQFTGPTPLIAAMRCHVTSKMGDEVDVPEELCVQQN